MKDTWNPTMQNSIAPKAKKTLNNSTKKTTLGKSNYQLSNLQRISLFKLKKDNLNKLPTEVVKDVKNVVESLKRRHNVTSNRF